MKISVKWLQEKNACPEAVEKFRQQEETDPVKIIEKMILQKEHLVWGNWLIVRTMTRPQYLAYAIFAAEQVIDIFEKKYPDDKRPRNAIEAAKAVLKNDTKQTRVAAWDAGAAAADAARDASVAKVAWAAGAAAGTASTAGVAWAAGAAWVAGTAWNAWNAWNAGDARDTGDTGDTGTVMQIKILKQGLKLIKGKKG